ncbi:MAG: DinB family protein, partial [Acidobacteriota bacterium]
PEVRSFAEQMLHLAYWDFAFTAGSFERTSPYKEEELISGEFKTRVRLSKIVGESYDFVINGLKGLSDAQLDEQVTLSDGSKALRIVRINDAYEHQTHHRGQTVIYLRLKGLVPPPEPF